MNPVSLHGEVGYFFIKLADMLCSTDCTRSYQHDASEKKEVGLVKKNHVVVVLMLCLMLASCAMARAPVTGCIYTDVIANDPGSVTSIEKGTKVGESTCTSILGWIATGDCSVAAAVKNGGISKIRNVDYKTKSILGIYAETKTIVYGD